MSEQDPLVRHEESLVAQDTLEVLALQRSIEAFLHTEADLLDAHRYRDWLALLAQDVTYVAPVRVNRRSDGRVEERPMYWFDENRATLELRVRRFETDVNWAEEPRSRTRRIVGNVKVDGSGGLEDVEVVSNLLVHRNRGDAVESDLIAAERRDRLRRVYGDWLLTHREILLDHATLPTKNLAILL